MEFTLGDLGVDLRTINVWQQNDYKLVLGVKVAANSYDAELNQKQALALGRALVAMGRSLEREES